MDKNMVNVLYTYFSVIIHYKSNQLIKTILTEKQYQTKQIKNLSNL